MITIFRTGYVLLLSYNPCDIFQYYNVEAMHGLSRVECEKYANTADSAYIAGWSNFVPKDSEEYTKLRQNKFREWWRKWHTDVLHDANMMPIVPNRYTTSFIIKNCTPQMLSILEPWCDDIYVDCDFGNYVATEENESLFKISEKVHSINSSLKNDIQIRFDASKLTNEHFTQFIKNIPFVIQETNQIGHFNWDIFEIDILNLRPVDMVPPIIQNIF